MPGLAKLTEELWRVFGFVLVVIFVAEASIMFLLPSILPAGVGWVTESVVDAFLLTLTVAPIFWWLLVRPLRRLAEFRTEMLALTISAQEQERRRIAGDLHDGVGQALTSLLIGLRTIADAEVLDSARLRASELREVVADTLEDVKRLVRGLRPSVLDDLGLKPALERLVSDAGKTLALDMSWDLAALEGSRLPEQLELTVYRIVQESLGNIAKHAQAKTVHVALEREQGELIVRVQDDGRGFVAASAKALIAEGHMGLTGMTERAVLLGGSLNVDTQPGEGTTVIARLPLPLEKMNAKNSGSSGR